MFRKALAAICAGVLLFGTAAALPEDVSGSGTDIKACAEGVPDGIKIKIDREHFPDDTFRAVISSADCDLDQDGYIDSEDIYYTRNIYCEGMGISSVKGVEYFTELRGLWCKDNNISSLDISALVNLTGLWCSNNPLTELDLSHNRELLWVYCYDCELTYVDFSNNPKMAFIEINTNDLTGLDVSSNPDLEHLTCGTCGLKELDLSNNKKLTHLDAFKNDLTKLDLSNNTKLKRLDIWWNTKLGNVDISGLTGLQYYNCAYNGVTELDLKNNPELVKLICSYNQISELDLSHNPKLSIIQCESNAIEALDLSANPKLRILKAAFNPFTELNIGNNPYLVKTYREGEYRKEYIFETVPAGYSWLIDYGGDTSTSGEDPSDRDNVCFIWLDEKVSISDEAAAELPAEEYYSEPDPGVTEKDMVTRGQVIMSLYEMAGSPDVSGLTSRFKDAAPGSEHYSALLWGEKNSICMGFPDFTSDTFGADKFITRQDLMFMLMRFSECMGYKRSIDFGRADDFSDYYEVDYDHWEAVTWAATWLILTGKGDPRAPKEERRIDPYGRATATEFRTMVNRMLEINNKDGSPIPGDADSSGITNMQDYALLQRWLAGWKVFIDEDACDLDGSGLVDMQDYALLQRMLAGWDIGVSA